MRTTIDLPDALFRRTKAVAALRGSSMKELIAQALEREVSPKPGPKGRGGHRVKVPLIRLKRPLDLRNFDFDELLP